MKIETDKLWRLRTGFFVSTTVDMLNVGDTVIYFDGVNPAPQLFRITGIEPLRGERVFEVLDH